MGMIPKGHIGPSPEQAAAFKQTKEKGSLTPEGKKKLTEEIEAQQAQRKALHAADFAVVQIPKTLEERIGWLAATVRQTGITQAASAEIIEVLGLLLRDVRELQRHFPAK